MPIAPPNLEEMEACCRSEVFRYALRRVGLRADAEDIAQETLCAALEQSRKFSGKVPLRCWLYGIARRDEASAEIRRLVLALPELQREALLLQLAEELSQAEIAQTLGKSVTAVNGLLARARQNIRQRGAAYFQPENSHAALVQLFLDNCLTQGDSGRTSIHDTPHPNSMRLTERGGAK
jgi:DNA-directed RNA polymerase specialized sigma24 family protein